MAFPIEYYQKRIIELDQKAQIRQQRYQRLVIFRVIIFLVGTAATFYCFGIHLLLGTIVLILSILALVLFINWHEKIKKKKQSFLLLKQLNEEEIQRYDGKFKAPFDGQPFFDASHPYLLDLDIFGNNSLYAYINRASTVKGKQILARWLSAPASKDKVKARQDAAKELSENPGWLQEWQIKGRQLEENPEAIPALFDWLNEPDLVKSKGWLKVTIFVAPIFTIALGVSTSFGVPFFFFLLSIIGQGFLLRQYYKEVSAIHQRTSNKSQILSLYSSLIEQTEASHFTSPFLQSLSKKLEAEGKNGSVAIRRLERLTEHLDLRLNIIGYLTFSLFLLWDYHIIWKLENWKASMKGVMKQWFDAIGEIDALGSLATMYFNNPQWAVPDIIDGDVSIKAKQLGHPLIPANKRVNNNFSLSGPKQIHLITGSNMAGKSTFLRTVGVNTVLALAGAPVCAESFSCTEMRVVSSMRNSDNLEQSESSFYAELKRLKLIIEEVQHYENVFFLIDEILKGTNSTDRHHGSVAMVHQLLKNEATGLVSTHDLELAEKALKIKNVTNYSFEVQIEKEQLHFDYTMRPGICRSFNASILMRQMGIDVELAKEKT